MTLSNPRRAGARRHPRQAVGGGLNTPPRLTRLLIQVKEKCSKACRKPFLNYFGHFLAQVTIEVTTGQERKNEYFEDTGHVFRKMRLSRKLRQLRQISNRHWKANEISRRWNVVRFDLRPVV